MERKGRVRENSGRLDMFPAPSEIKRAADCGLQTVLRALNLARGCRGANLEAFFSKSAINTRWWAGRRLRREHITI
jgi:hypothetical protein